MSPTIAYILHTIAGMIVLAEALNKLERTCPIEPGMSARQLLVVWLKTFGWSALAIGSAGAAACALLYRTPPSFGEVCTMSGFALLVLRSRVGEVLPERAAKANS